MIIDKRTLDLAEKLSEEKLQFLDEMKISCDASGHNFDYDAYQTQWYTIQIAKLIILLSEKEDKLQLT